MIRKMQKKLMLAISVVLMLVVLSQGLAWASDGTFLLEWGSFGTGDGEFDFPWGVAVDSSSGDVYVADSDNNRIQKFNSTGSIQILEWGSPGALPGEFDFPTGVAVDSSSGDVYVVDTFNDRIQKFDSTGAFLLEWGSFGALPGEFDEPYGVAVDSGSGDVYVADTFNDRIQKFDSTGAFLLEWGTLGTNPGEFDEPYGVAVDSSGSIVYVADNGGNDRIQKFDDIGTFLLEWGSTGALPGEFDFPTGVAVDSSGFVYVADSNNNRIQKFTTTAELTVVPPVGDVNPGDVIDVQLEVTNATGLQGLEATCTVDPAILEIQSSVYGTLFSNQGSVPPALDAVAGTWLGAVYQQAPDPPFSGDGNFATLTYEALMGGTSLVECVPLFVDRDGNVQPFVVNNASITVLDFGNIIGKATYQGRAVHDLIDVTAEILAVVVNSDTTDPAGDFDIINLPMDTYDVQADADGYLPSCTTAVVTSGATTDVGSTELLGGDVVNNDNEINIGDAALVGFNFGETVPPANPAADINNDGMVNVQDLAILGGNFGLSGCQPW